VVDSSQKNAEYDRNSRMSIDDGLFALHKKPPHNETAFC